MGVKNPAIQHCVHGFAVVMVLRFTAIFTAWNNKALCVGS